MARCDALAGCSEEPCRITRPYGTHALRAAQVQVAGWISAAGLDVHRDAIGNLRAKREGNPAAAPVFLLGSHLDSVRDGGRFDGPLGVLVALAVVERLQAEDVHLPFPIEVVAFADEEGLRFQTAYLGSRALAGTIDLSWLDRTDADGISLREAIVAFGGDPAALPSAALRTDQVMAYVEVHIEQGPRLESAGAAVGVVTAIAGQTRGVVTFAGEARHAGTVAMPLRRDALAAAAECILAVEQLARQTPDLVATVGQIDVEPGASNVIPGKARLTLDVRHPLDAARDLAVSTLETRSHEIASARSMRLDWRIVQEDDAVRCDPTLTARLAAAIASTGLPVERLASGAGHDGAIMATIAPMAMLFVRCAGGVSHHPAESVTAADVAVAIDVIDRFVDGLAMERRSC